MGRRGFLVGAGATLGVAALGGLAYQEDWVPGTERIKRRFADTGPDGTIPDAPAGDVRLERFRSEARGTEVGLFTAVPHGHGDGAGLPVCLVLHGASATTADYERFGFPRFLTAAARAGTPFALVGVDGGRKQWRSAGPDDPDDPQRMLIDEVPTWLAGRDLDWSRRAAWGWSMGGFGALLLAEALGDGPDRLAAVAAFSPALPEGPEDLPPTDDGRPRDVWSAADRLAGTPVGLWCGTADPLLERVQRFAEDLDPAPRIASWTKGAHERGYWDRVTPEALRLVGDALA